MHCRFCLLSLNAQCAPLFLGLLLSMLGSSRAFLTFRLKPLLRNPWCNFVVAEQNRRLNHLLDLTVQGTEPTVDCERRYNWRRPYRIAGVIVSAGEGAGEIGGVREMSGDHREQAQQLHATMSSEKREERLQQPSRETHEQRQAAVFDSKVGFFASKDATPPTVLPSLRRIAEACRPDHSVGDDGSSHVVDVGCGTGALVNFLKQAGVPEINVIGVDLSAEMSTVFRDRFPEAESVHASFESFADALLAARVGKPSASANAVKEGEGTQSDLGEADSTQDAKKKAIGAVVFNASFGNLWDQRAALERAGEILEEGGKVIISHPLGKEFVQRLKEIDATVVPHDLPEETGLQQLVQFLPFQIQSCESDENIYLAILRRTPYRVCETVRYLRGEVSRGYGRGSKKLGVPTANLPESQFAENLRSLATGVYFGWASLEDAESSDNNQGPWKCVANVGYSPTFAGQENAEKIVEGHLIGYEGEDFYEKTMRLALVGFQRFERKFASFPELIATINKDVDDAASALEEPRFATFKTDTFFSKPPCALDAWWTRDFGSAFEEAASQTS